MATFAVDGYALAFGGLLLLGGKLTGLLGRLRSRPAVPEADEAETLPPAEVTTPDGWPGDGGEDSTGNGQPLPAPANAAPPRFTGPAPWGSVGVQGHVRRADGTPVPDAILTLMTLDGRQAGRAVSGHGGAFRLRAPRAGSYAMITVSGGLRPQADTVVAGAHSADHDVMMQAATSLAGTVRRAGTGEPLAGAALSLADTRGDVVAGHATDNAGRYQFENLIPGGYTLVVTASRHQPAALPVTIADGRQVTQDVQLTADPAHIHDFRPGGPEA